MEPDERLAKFSIETLGADKFFWPTTILTQTL